MRATLLALCLLLATDPAHAAPPDMTRDQLLCRAQSGLGFSYWWGHGTWCANGCSPDYGCGKGSCSGSCYKIDGVLQCTHSGSRGADCSGYVARIWNVPYEKPLTTNWHPYSTYNFYWESTHWDHISKGDLKKGDALVYRKLTPSGYDDGGGHVMFYQSGDGYGYSTVNHAKGCSYGIVHENKSIESKYKARRRHHVIEAECTPGQSQTQACGNCGTQSRTCSSQGLWGGWSECAGQGECPAGTTQTEACGNCGTQSRSCSGSCSWGGWSECTGQGECAAGTDAVEACGDCGSHQRLCQSDCSWSAWSDCAGPDPQGDEALCDSGLPGVCAAGTAHCVEGWLECTATVGPSPELCDGLDNDCDGLTDNGAVEMGPVPPLFAAELVDLSFPQALAAGRQALVWVDFLNVGTEPWPKRALWLAPEPDGEFPSPFYLATGWAAWDTAATVEQPVAPGEVGRFQFRIQAPDRPGTVVAETFRLLAPSGAPLFCPLPTIDLAVKVLPGPAVGSAAAPLSPRSGSPCPLETGEQALSPDGETTAAGCTTGAEPAGAAGLVLVLTLLALAALRCRWKPPLLLVLVLLSLLSGCGLFDDAAGTGTTDLPDLQAEIDVPPAAAITSIEPTTVGPLGGETVTVHGTGFQPDATVVFASIYPATTTTVVSDELLEAVTPPLPAGPHYVRVEQSGGEWPRLPFGITVRPLSLTFVQAPEYSFPPLLEQQVDAAVVTDYNNDQASDLVLVADGLLVGLRGQGNGNFILPADPRDEPAVPRFPKEPFEARDLLAADWNADGRVDLFVATGEGTPCALLLQQEDSTFLPAGDFPELLDDVRAAAVGDINQDGFLDLVLLTGPTADGTPGQHRVLLNTADAPGSFQATPSAWPNPPPETGEDLALADFDRDGDLDLVTGASAGTGGQMVRFYRNEEGILVPGDLGAIPPVGSPVSSLVAVDVDQDKRVDLVLSVDGQDLLLRNDGQAHFFNDTVAALPVDKLPGGVVRAADIDLDGFPDLVLGHDGHQNRLYLNDGTGHFLDETPLLPMAQDATTDCILTDVDANGATDVFFLGASGTANLLLLTFDLGPGER